MLSLELTDRPIFSANDAKAAGVSQLDLRHAIRAGSIIRLKRGWYTGRPIAWPRDRHQFRVAVELAQRPALVASHYSALVSLGLPVHRPDWTIVHLMRVGPGPARHRPGLLVHQRVDGVEQPDAALAAAQASLLCPTSGLMSLDAALRRGLTTTARFNQMADLLQGRPGAAHLATVTRLASPLRESPLESRAALMCDAWGWDLDPQFEIPGTHYRADARIRNTRVLIEVDGEVKYEAPGAVYEEKAREDEIRALGWEVVRVTSALLDERATLYQRIDSALRLARRRAPVS